MTRFAAAAIALLVGIIHASAQDIRVNPPLGLPSASGAFTCTAAGTCTLNPISSIATSLAIGGATIGSNALAVTGTSLFTGAITGTSALALGGAGVGSVSVGGLGIAFSGSPNLELPGTGGVSWANGVFTNSKDLFLLRDAANTLAQRNGVNAQTFNLYNTFTDASNYSRLSLATTGSDFLIQSVKAGSPGTGGIYIDVPTGQTVSFTKNNTGTINWKIDANGHLLAGTDNTYDIGASGATRPRTGYFGTSIISPIGTFATSIQTTCVAVGSLPAAGTAGRRKCVTDQLTVCAAAGAALTGGGAVVCPVFDNGVAWVGD